MSKYGDLRATLLYTRKTVEEIKTCFKDEFSKGFASFLEVPQDKVRIKMAGTPRKIEEDQFEWEFDIFLGIDGEWPSLEGLFKITGNLDEIKPGKFYIVPANSFYEGFLDVYDYNAIFKEFTKELSKLSLG